MSAYQVTHPEPGIAIFEQPIDRNRIERILSNAQIMRAGLSVDLSSDYNPTQLFGVTISCAMMAIRLTARARMIAGGIEGSAPEAAAYAETRLNTLAKTIFSHTPETLADHSLSELLFLQNLTRRITNRICQQFEAEIRTL